MSATSSWLSRTTRPDRHSREDHASLRGRHQSRHRMGSEEPAEQSKMRHRAGLGRRGQVVFANSPSLVPSRGAPRPAGAGRTLISRRRRFRPPAPVELGAVYPHSVEDNANAASERDDGLLMPAATRDLRRPGLQSRPALDPRQQNLCCLIERAAHHGVAHREIRPVRSTSPDCCLRGVKPK